MATITSTMTVSSAKDSFFGTMEYVDGSHTLDEMEAIVTQALNTSEAPKKIDCAEIYQSTEAVGRAIQAYNAIEVNPPVFVSTKLNGLPSGPYEAIKERVNQHLLKLGGLSKVELLLIHFPGPSDCDFGGSPEMFAKKANFDFYKANIGEAWANMVQLKNDGLCDDIGVSNFYQSHLNVLLEVCGEENKPHCNQIFIDPCHPEFELCDFMTEQGIGIMAYRPLSFVSHMEMVGGMGDTTFAKLQELANTHCDGNVRGFILCWLLKRGISPIFKSSNVEHVQSNAVAMNKVGTMEEFDVRDDSVFGNADMVNVVGGCDEYSQAIRGVCPN